MFQKASLYSITECMVPELIPVLCSQPAGDVSHKPGGRLPLLSTRPAVTPATLKDRNINCRILYDHYLPTVILIVILIIGIPSPTHSFTLGLNPSFSANSPYHTLSFFSFRFHYMDFPDCLLLLLSTSVYLLFSFPVFTLFYLSVPCSRLS